MDELGSERVRLDSSPWWGERQLVAPSYPTSLCAERLRGWMRVCRVSALELCRSAGTAQAVASSTSRQQWTHQQLCL